MNVHELVMALETLGWVDEKPVKIRLPGGQECEITGVTEAVDIYLEFS